MSKNSSENGLLQRRVEKILPSRDGLEKLLQKRKIRVYMGADPTSRLHVGHGIGLKLLNEFAQAGHDVVFLYGTGTVLVGDPSQRESGRKLITESEIKQNIQDWQKVASKILDFSKVEVVQNADWLTKLSLKELIGIASNISATQLFKRESFTNRIKKGDTVWYHETLYPVLQGYDSVELDVDLEIGGTDQEFNMLMGRELLKKMKGKDKYVLTLPLILGTDGQKMSGSSGNAVWMDDSPAEMYGKLMRLPDSQSMLILRLATDVDDAELATIAKQPARAAKGRMALEVTSIYHGQDAGQKAAAAFDAQFKEGKTPEKIAEIKLERTSWDVGDLLVTANLVSSKSEARRLLAQGGVKLNSQVQTEPELIVKDGDVLQVGKRKFVKLRVA